LARTGFVIPEIRIHKGINQSHAFYSPH